MLREGVSDIYAGRFSRAAMYEQDEYDDVLFGSDQDVRRCRGRHERAAKLAAEIIDAGLVRSSSDREHKRVLKLLEATARRAIKAHPDAGERRRARGLLRLLDIVRGGHVQPEPEDGPNDDPLGRKLHELVDESYARSPLEVLAAIVLGFGLDLSMHRDYVGEGYLFAKHVRGFGTVLCAVAGIQALDALVDQLRELEARP